jgi:hypothetical protein
MGPILYCMVNVDLIIAQPVKVALHAGKLSTSERFKASEVMTSGVI